MNPVRLAINKISNQIHLSVIHQNFHFNQIHLNQINLISQRRLNLVLINFKNHKLMKIHFKFLITNKKIKVNLVS